MWTGIERRQENRGAGACHVQGALKADEAGTLKPLRRWTYHIDEHSVFDSPSSLANRQTYSDWVSTFGAHQALGLEYTPSPNNTACHRLNRTREHEAVKIPSDY